MLHISNISYTLSSTKITAARKQTFFSQNTTRLLQKSWHSAVHTGNHHQKQTPTDHLIQSSHKVHVWLPQNSRQTLLFTLLICCCWLMLMIWLSLFSTCSLFQRLLNGLPLVSCTSTWRQTTFFHVPVGVSEKLYDRNSDAACLVWYTKGCRRATGDTAWAAGHIISFRCVDHSIHDSGSALVWCSVCFSSQYFTECGYFWPTEHSRLPTL